MKKSIILTAAVIAAMLLSGCGDIEIGSAPAQASAASDTPAPIEIAQAEATRIILSGDSASVEGGGASVNGSVISISASGEYTVSGKLNDGYILVNTGEDAKNVTITLEGADISCSTGAAIYCQQAKKLTINLASGTENLLTSGSGSEISKADESAQGAVIFSEDDLNIKGDGSLTITAYINNGITGKDDVKIKSGSLRINAANNGIRGSESVVIESGSVEINAKNDGIKSTSVTKENKGFITIEDGSISIISGGDGVSAAKELTINGGNISVSAAGTELLSGKAVKSGSTMTINGGVFDLASDTDKAISCGANIYINGGSFTLSSGKDGIASPSAVIINSGSFSITAAGDGIQAGEKGGSTGTVSLSNGSLCISAGSSPVNAKGIFEISGGSLYASGNSKSVKNLNLKGISAVWFTSGSQLAAKSNVTVSAADDSFTASLTPDRGYKLIIVAAPEIIGGNEYSMTAGNVKITSTAS